MAIFYRFIHYLFEISAFSERLNANGVRNSTDKI